MKFIVLLTCFAVSFVCADQQVESGEEIADGDLLLGQEPEIHINDDGTFVLSFIDENGWRYEEEGIVLTDEKTGEEIVLSKRGSYTYQDEDGKRVRVAYDIDEPAADEPTSSK